MTNPILLTILLTTLPIITPLIRANHTQHKPKHNPEPKQYHTGIQTHTSPNGKSSANTTS